ncbi:MAG: hypothetical protein WAM18_08720, partial [Halobacillus sp.]
ELPISQGLEGDDVDSCGMNMFGETPQSLLEEAQHMPAESEIVPRRTFLITQYLEIKSSTNGSFTLKLNGDLIGAK